MYVCVDICETSIYSDREIDRSTYNIRMHNKSRPHAHAHNRQHTNTHIRTHPHTHVLSEEASERGPGSARSAHSSSTHRSRRIVLPRPAMTEQAKLATAAQLRHVGVTAAVVARSSPSLSGMASARSSRGVHDRRLGTPPARGSTLQATGPGRASTPATRRAIAHPCSRRRRSRSAPQLPPSSRGCTGRGRRQEASREPQQRRRRPVLCLRAHCGAGGPPRSGCLSWSTRECPVSTPSQRSVGPAVNYEVEFRGEGRFGRESGLHAG
jgi:hypothetical protein